MSRYAVLALAVAGAVYAQDDSSSSSQSCGGTATVTNAGDVSSLVAGCTTFDGSIAVATDFAGLLDFPGVQEITGDLTIKNAPEINNVNAEAITAINGTFSMNNLTRLAGMNWPQLVYVNKIEWVGLPNLNTLAFQSQIQQTESFDLENTFLSDLTGINLTNCSTFTIANNGNLQQFSMNLQNVTGDITMQQNGARMNVTFPYLKSARNITIHGVPSLSMPNLANLDGGLDVSENDMLDSLMLPKLQTVGDSFSINNNKGLKNYTAPVLTSVGGAVNVQNNTQLDVVTFPKLQTVSGAFNSFGNFTNITLPAIKDIRGDFNVQSSEDITSDCDTFKAESGTNSAIKGGTYFCEGKQATPSDSAPSGSDNSNGGSGSGSKNAANGGHIDSSTLQITGVLGVFAAMLGML